MFAILIVVGLVLSFTPAPARGQAIGATLRGTVIDESGALVPGVSITIVNRANGRTQTTLTGDRGEYRIVALLPSTYQVIAELAGFAPAREELTLTVGTEVALDLTLRVAGVSASVVAEAPASATSVAQSRPSSLVVAAELAALPELGRNFLTLAQVLPGSAPLNATVARSLSTKFGGVADQRSGFTTLIDGGDIDDAQWGSPTMNVTQESVQEFKVFRYQFDSQYGNALGAVVSVATKSGGNDLRGNAFYFGRDARLNEKNPLAQSKPPFDEQKFGASIGGPLARNRTHFFATYEQDHVDTARIIALSAANPFAVEENGNFPAWSNERMAVARVDHRFSPQHSGLIRYLYDNQDGERNVQTQSDSSQIDMSNRAHSVIGEEDWVISPRAVNTFRVHAFFQTTSGVPHHAVRGPAIQRPALSTGLVNGGDWATFPRSKVTVSNTAYVTSGRHDLKFGGEVAFGDHELHGHYFEDGLFVFRIDLPFNADVPGTWPTSFSIQSPSVQRYHSRQFAGFVQDDWRLGARVRINAGLRYDLDTNLRINEFYSGLLADPAMAGLDAFVSDGRGTDTNNLQPRAGATVDLAGDGSVVLRGGWGQYVARNRPWYQLRSMNQLAEPGVLVEDPQRLRLYPDIAAIIAGTVPRQLGTVIPDDFVQSYAQNTSAGVAWQLGRATSLNVDYIHSFGDHQTGFTDRNLPPSGAVTPANPRPAASFAQVLMLENFSLSWYDAVETEFRTRLRGGGNLHASYTLSRTWLDGVDFFSTQRGTQRTPQETGFSPSDQRHNFTAAATLPLPFEMQISAIVKLISGSPMLVQAGFDTDGDRSPAGDRPRGLPITVGRDDNDAALRLINDLRAGLTPALAPVDPALLDLDPYRTVDVRLTKSFRAGRRARVDLLIEAFNVTNHVNLVPTTVNRNINSGAFLERRTAREARQIQWGLRLAM